MLTKRELADRARTLKRLDDERKRVSGRECELIVDMGKILIDTRARMKGGWKEWASEKKNLPFSYRTAAHYIEVAEKVKLISPFFVTV